MPEGDGPRSDVAEATATKQERIDFLKQVIAFSEANVRSYDIKAQISLAAFVLSGSPLVAIITAACEQRTLRSVLVIALVVFIATILSYLWVLWPVVSLQQRLTEGLGAGNLFYIRDPLKIAGRSYSDQLKSLALEPELTAEALKLSHIRNVKARRFKTSLITTVIAYLFVTASFFGVGRCAF
jgi:hypothetical protein